MHGWFSGISKHPHAHNHGDGAEISFAENGYIVRYLRYMKTQAKLPKLGLGRGDYGEAWKGEGENDGYAHWEHTDVVMLCHTLDEVKDQLALAETEYRKLRAAMDAGDV